MIKIPELLFVCCLFSLFYTTQQQQQQQPTHIELLAIADAATYDYRAKADPAPTKYGVFLSKIWALEDT